MNPTSRQIVQRPSGLLVVSDDLPLSTETKKRAVIIPVPVLQVVRKGFDIPVKVLKGA